jgi:hypothetical protein
MNDTASSSRAQIWVATIGLVGVLGGAVIANWDRIFPNNPEPSPTPVVTPTPNPTPLPASTPTPVPTPTQRPDPSPPASDVIAGRYLMDHQRNRVIVVSRIAGANYRIEEPSSPWPWSGTATFDGTNLSGLAEFTQSLATMKVRGVRRGDGSIVIEYEFLTRGDGSPGAGKIDRHIWYPD